MKITIKQQVEQTTKKEITLPYYGVCVKSYSKNTICVISENAYIEVINYGNSVVNIGSGCMARYVLEANNFTEITEAEFLKEYNETSKHIHAVLLNEREEDNNG